MDNVKDILEKQRLYFYQGKTKNIDFRLENLKTLRNLIINNESAILEALRKDLSKSPFEAYATEIGMILEEINYTIKHLRKWTKKKKVRTPITQFLSSSYIYSEPYGVTFIMSPWNYPFQLAISPLIGSIAAGNCTVIKPSEYSPFTSELIYKLISENFSEDYIAVVNGGLDVNKALLEEKFDYIFFTGGTAVGKIVMEAASKHLTPVTLELGGKSPCIIDESANIDLSAKRIIWGKLLNAGQTCVAPDYLLVHKSIKNELINKLQKYITEFYGTDPCNNSQYPKIINQKHFNRLIDLIDNRSVKFGGTYNNLTNKIAPTILDNVTLDSKVMEDEIFGPILPIIEFESINEVISIVNRRAKPLALYYFSEDKSKQDMIINNISFGGGCINDTIVHLATPYMPFGGVGDSGMGSYHGKGTFDTFSHKKSILKKSNLFDIPLRYPPFKDNIKFLKTIMK